MGFNLAFEGLRISLLEWQKCNNKIQFLKIEDRVAPLLN
jgi:hypothetical protein